MQSSILFLGRTHHICKFPFHWGSIFKQALYPGFFVPDIPWKHSTTSCLRGLRKRPNPCLASEKALPFLMIEPRVAVVVLGSSVREPWHHLLCFSPCSLAGESLRLLIWTSNLCTLELQPWAELKRFNFAAAPPDVPQPHTAKESLLRPSLGENNTWWEQPGTHFQD